MTAEARTYLAQPSANYVVASAYDAVGNRTRVTYPGTARLAPGGVDVEALHRNSGTAGIDEAIFVRYSHRTKKVSYESARGFTVEGRQPMTAPSEFVPMRLHFGAPNPADVVGRDNDSARFWEAVKSGSLRVIAERRMGKTWLLKRALADPPAWARALFLDVEGHQLVQEFVRDLNRALHAQGLIDEGWWQRAQDWFRRWVSRLGSAATHGAKLQDLAPWPDFLRDTCRRISEANGSSKAVVVFDEFPSFLDGLVKAEHAGEASQLLGILRELRQEHESLRFVFCGSLGLHVVLERLRDSGYSGRPVNDMPPHEVAPLAEPWATYLAGCLLTGESVACDDTTACARAVARASCGVPFYIQHLVKWLKDREAAEAWTAARIDGVPEEAARAAGDPFELAYYDERLDAHYRGMDLQADRARAALDVLSRDPEGLPFDQILNLVRHRPESMTLDSAGMLAVLRTLREDHYVTETGTAWRFKVDIVRRAWRARRGDMGL